MQGPLLRRPIAELGGVAPSALTLAAPRLRKSAPRIRPDRAVNLITTFIKYQSRRDVSAQLAQQRSGEEDVEITLYSTPFAAWRQHRGYRNGRGLRPGGGLH